MSDNAIIKTENLTKAYGNFLAVDKLNLQIGEGEIFGFLGPNGAGKTTTILMLMGLTEPTSGMVSVCGFNPSRSPVQVKKFVGYLPEKVGFYEDLTARQNLEYTARLNGLLWKDIPEKVVEVLHQVGLTSEMNREVGKFSHGMKQRLGIADVLIKDPRVIFFDEPTSGIDPQGIDEVLTLISHMAERKITAIISSHQLHHIQRVCSRVGIMSKGHLITEGPIEMLGRATMAQGKYRIDVQASPITEKLIDTIKNLESVVEVESKGDRLIITCDEDLRSKISKIVVDNDSMLTEVKIEEFDLEKIYLKYFRES